MEQIRDTHKMSTQDEAIRERVNRIFSAPEIVRKPDPVMLKPAVPAGES